MSAQYKRILVTLDGSGFSAQALPHAQLLAHSLSAELVLLRVVAELHPEGDAAGVAGRFMNVSEIYARDLTSEQQNQLQVIEQAEHTLNDIARVFESQQIKSETVVKVGKPAEKIVDFAENNDIDLIVMSTHGRTGLAHLVYGSVAEKVLHEAHCPVLLIKVSR